MDVVESLSRFNSQISTSIVRSDNRQAHIVFERELAFKEVVSHERESVQDPVCDASGRQLDWTDIEPYKFRAFEARFPRETDAEAGGRAATEVENPRRRRELRAVLPFQRWRRRVEEWRGVTSPICDFGRQCERITAR